MKAPKNRLKLLRVQCGMCKATQDSLNTQCSACGNPLYTNMTPEELAGARALVEGLEKQLETLEKPAAKGSPYGPYDGAAQMLRGLKGFAYLPGMGEYIDAVRALLLPYKVKLMRNQWRANLVFCVVLLGFAFLPLALGWPFMIVLLMLMPAAAWIFLTFRAWRALQRAEAQLYSIG